MLDNIFIIKFTENIIESKMLREAIGDLKRYYEAYLSHRAFEISTYTTFMGKKKKSIKS